MASIKNIFSPRTEVDEGFLIAIKKIIFFRPKNIQLFVEAFTHSSMNEKIVMGLLKITKEWNFWEMQFLVL